MHSRSVCNIVKEEGRQAGSSKRVLVADEPKDVKIYFMRCFLVVGSLCNSYSHQKLISLKRQRGKIESILEL